MNSLVDEYLRLGPLHTRIAIHQRYSELEHDVELEVIRTADVTGADELLDIGCGTGAFLSRLHAGGHSGRLVGLDSSPVAVEAARRVDGVAGILGDATDLPFACGEFDVVAARHMLYHVEDPVAAIREAHRVLRPEGRFVAVVNHADSTPHIADVVRAHAIRAGIEPPTLPISRVHSDNLPAMISEAFPTVTVRRHDNALVFPEPEPAIRYGLALLNFYGVGDESPEREDVVRGVIDDVRGWFATNLGPWRDPKGYAVCVAVRD